MILRQTRLGRCAVLMLLATGAPAVLCFCSGCQELVHMGQISDQESSWSIGGATIEQQQPDGAWKRLGETDGNGRWWIMKKDLQSGGRIRVMKPGYYPRVLPESDFMQEHNILMIPSGDSGSDDADLLWQGGG